MAQRNVLYRFFDGDGVLLYIGISMTPWERFRQHRSDKPWWDSIRQTTIEPYGSREDVLAAEKAAIIAEKPLHNIQHNHGNVIGPNAKPVRKPTKWTWMEPGQQMLTVRSRHGHSTTGMFQLVYEVDLDPISDDYYWDDIDPRELFIDWQRRVERKHGKHGFVPIYWFVSGPGIFEFADREQHGSESRRGGFQSYYHLPVDAQGRWVQLEDLPVQDKQWSAKQADKGGFIPVATGWKPRAFQPEVSIRDLRNQTMRKHWVLGVTKWELVTA